MTEVNEEEIVRLLNDTDMSYVDIVDKIGSVSYSKVANLGLKVRSEDKRKRIRKKVLANNRKGISKAVGSEKECPSVINVVTEFAIRGVALSWEDLLKKVHAANSVVQSDKPIGFTLEISQDN